MISLIPWAFIRERVWLSWRDASIGYRRQWLSWDGAIALACSRLSEGEDDPLVVELAGISKVAAACVGPLLDTLASHDTTDEATSKDKWLYLNLAWLFENKNKVDDPLGAVECVYADFDYPEEVAPFVRYMPVTDGYDPSIHSSAENFSRLMINWQAYLGRAGSGFQSTLKIAE